MLFPDERTSEFSGQLSWLTRLSKQLPRLWMTVLYCELTGTLLVLGLTLHFTVNMWHWPRDLCQLNVYTFALSSLTSPGFVARRGKAGNYVMGHSRRTSGPGAAAARWLIVLWLMQYWSKDHQLISQTIQYLDSWLSDLLQSKLTRCSAIAETALQGAL